MGFALARLGCDPAAVSDQPTVLDLVEGHGASVVVIDGTELLADAKKLAKALSALDPAVHVLVVHEDARRISSPSFPLLAKWDEPEALAHEALRRHVAAGGAVGAPELS